MNAKHALTISIMGAAIALPAMMHHSPLLQARAHDHDCADHQQHEHDESCDHGEHEHDEHEAPGMHDESDDHAEHDEHGEDDGHEAHEAHTEHDEHIDSDSHAGHDHDEHGDAIPFDAVGQVNPSTAVAGSGTIDTRIRLLGEIKVNEDRMAHIVPRMEGVVTDVRKRLGDTVAAGEIMAVIESRELADAQAAYLAARERYEMAQLILEREEKLWKDKVSAEQDYLQAKQTLAETRIAQRTAEQKLFALGFDRSYLQALAEKTDQNLTRFELTAPFTGRVIAKHIVLGESVQPDTDVFTVADLNTVWVDLNVYAKDLPHIQPGQSVAIETDAAPLIQATIDYVDPTMTTESRTVPARVVLPNTSGMYRPGLFVTAYVAVAQERAEIVVLKIALQTIDGRKCVFVKDEHGYAPVFVTLGRQNATHVEVVAGLKPGQQYVTEGAFAMKSIMVTSTLDSHAGHGH